MMHGNFKYQFYLFMKSSGEILVFYILILDTGGGDQTWYNGIWPHRGHDPR